MIIYALIDPATGQLRYIGKTHRTAHRRLRRHLAPTYLNSESTHKARWIRQLVAQGLEPEIEVLETCTSAAELCDAERFHISYWRFLGADLTNATDGGDGIGMPHTEESKRKIATALRGKKKSDQHRTNAGASRRGISLSEAHRAKLSQVRRGKTRRPLDEAHRIAIRDGKGGRAFFDQFGNRYETQKGAARQLGLDVAHVNAVLKGARRHTRGYVFSYERVQEWPR